MDFYQYYKIHHKQSEKQTAEILKNEKKDIVTLDVGYIGHSFTGVSKKDVVCLNMLHDFMIYSFKTPQEVFEELNDGNILHHSLNCKCLRVLARYPYQHEWVNDEGEENFLKMTNEEIFAKNIQQSLKDLKEHGANYIILSIGNKNKADKNFARQLP